MILFMIHGLGLVGILDSGGIAIVAGTLALDLVRDGDITAHGTHGIMGSYMVFTILG